MLVLSLIIAIGAIPFYYSRRSKITITNESKQLFLEYINSHPEAAEHEKHCSGINDLSKVDEYFAIELLEEDHRDVLEAIRKNNNVFSTPLMKRWIAENYQENYVERKAECD
jgi:hypothetical protein